ncbi:Rgg/GadR/MutR family transcriptional regulator [Ligilactobacillus animalis]|uniref:Rgg/GadR/MutR family transcriptional regulator n=1 Tax=Ligilactobacillus animalis TaxID=1605 RepID=UPI001C110895|nr:Rgg/GadR/MutR family transcriptional regulator [Ligilactobacillus animalis]MBU5278857.1 hypothetical protein [Ligilactobacillus animalis]
MEYHKVISELRTNKNIKVSELIGDNMSRSSYNRFISGKADIYSQHLLALLDQLHVSFSKLEYIANGYNTSKEDTFFLKVILAARAKDHEGLILCYRQAQSLAQPKHNDFYTHVLGALDLVIRQLKSQPYNLSDNALYTYLIQAFSWTDYEFKFFQLILPALSPAELEPFLAKIERNLAKFGSATPYNQKSFNLICDIIFYFIQHQNYVNASHYLTLLENYDLTENLVYEKLLLTFFTNLKKLLLHQPANTWRRPLTKCIATAKFLDMPNLAEKFEQTILQITN